MVRVMVRVGVWLEPSRKHGRKMRSQPAAPGALPLTCTQTRQRQLQTIKYNDGVGKHYMALYELVVKRRRGQPRACSSRPYTRTELGARCLLHCSLLLAAASCWPF